MAEAHTPLVMTGNQTTAGAVFEAVNLTLRGSVFSSIAVPPGTVLVISSISIASIAGPSLWSLDYSTDGINFTPVAEMNALDVAVAPGPIYNFNVALAFNGNAGPDVRIALLVLTSGGPTQVTCTITGYTEP